MDKKEYHKLYRLNHLEQFRQYRENWNDRHPTYHRDRYMKSKEENKIICDKCGKETTTHNLKRHQTSKRCIFISQGHKGYSKFIPLVEKPAVVEQLEVAVDVLTQP
jgi:hypothetical protein